MSDKPRDIVNDNPLNTPDLCADWNKANKILAVLLEPSEPNFVEKAMLAVANQLYKRDAQLRGKELPEPIQFKQPEPSQLEPIPCPYEAKEGRNPDIPALKM